MKTVIILFLQLSCFLTQLGTDAYLADKIDYTGLMPGTPFSSFEAAVVCFAINFNDNAIRDNVEYGTTLYSYTGKQGNKIYSYTLVFKSETDKSAYIPPAPSGTFTVGFAHMHAAYNKHKYNPDVYPDWNPSTSTGYPDDFFSEIDKNLVQSAQHIIGSGFRGILVCSDGSIKEYHALTAHTITWKQNYNIPSDPARVYRKTGIPGNKLQLQNLPDEHAWTISLSDLPGMRLPQLSGERRLLFDPRRIRETSR